VPGNRARPPKLPNAWIYSTQLVDKAGRAMTAQFVQSACPGVGGGPSANGAPGVLGSGGSHQQASAAAQNRLAACGVKAAAKFHEVVTYQPASRYWALQSLELAIVLGVALILAGLCLSWVRRRLS
jgi:hypothetical protein